MSEAGQFLLALAAGSGLIALQAHFLPLGYERDQPPGRRTLNAIMSFAVIMIFITVAHAILPGHTTIAAVAGATAAVMVINHLRGRFYSTRPPAGR